MTAPWGSTDYALDWPPDLLVRELHELLNAPYRAWTAGDVEQLLREAFHTNVPADTYARLDREAQWTDGPSSAQRWLSDLARNLRDVRQYEAPVPYWSARQCGASPAPSAPCPEIAPDRFAELIGLLHADGYLARDFVPPCPTQDSDDYRGKDLNQELRSRLHDTDPATARWPLRPADWDRDTFLSLVEVFHDLVARPRWSVTYEECCGTPHFGDFDTDSGQRVYTALINRLLAAHGVYLRVADTGEDVGRLVEATDHARADLIDRALGTPDPAAHDKVSHAISLFRAREASAEDKRSAVIALAGVLEARRELIRHEIGRRDEGALFTLANEFAIRHQRRGQQGDYDPAFLDWMFWWYLATIELTTRVIARQDAEAGA